MAALGLCCCAWAFSICGEWELLFVAVRRLLIVVASPVAEHRLQTRRLSGREGGVEDVLMSVSEVLRMC